MLLQLYEDIALLKSDKLIPGHIRIMCRPNVVHDSCQKLRIKCPAALCVDQFTLFAIVSSDGTGNRMARADCPDYNSWLDSTRVGQTDDRVIKASPTPTVRSFYSVPVGD